MNMKDVKMDIKVLFKKEYIIGLDIGTSSIKLAKFAAKKDGLHLVKAAIEEIAPPVIARATESAEAISGSSRDDDTASAIKKLLHGIDAKKSKIIASVNCPMTAIKKAVVPHMPKGDLEAGLSLEAKNYFPFPIDNEALDFEILSDVVEKGTRKYEVAIAASPKATVDAHLALLEKAGIKPASLIPCAYALQKIAEYSTAEEDKTQCFIDIGERCTEALILKNKSLAFSRKIPIAAGDFTKAMTGALVSDRGKIELTIPEAQKIKEKIGIPPEGESKIIDDKISATQVLSMLRTPAEQLANEIDRCFDFYREETGAGKVDSVTLFGGGAALQGLVKFLSGQLGMEVTLGDAYKELAIEPNAIPDKDKTAYRMDSAIGAALSGGKGINLLPLEIKEEMKRTFTRATVQGVATAIILIAALLYTGMKIQLDNFRKRISVAQLELSSLQPQLKKSEALHLANMVLVDEPHWEDIFKELSNVTPEYIYLTRFSMDNAVLTLEGVVATRDGEELLSDFILTLERGIFKNVKLLQTKDLEEQQGNTFKLRCEVE